MSELTICNFCNMRRYTELSKELRGNVVTVPNYGKLGGFDIYIVPYGEVIDKRVDSKTGNHLSNQWKAWLMEIPEDCCC